MAVYLGVTDPSDLTGPQADRFTLEFEPFAPDTPPAYRRREVRPFLEREYKRISVIVVETGRALNEALRARPLARAAKPHK